MPHDLQSHASFAPRRSAPHGGERWDEAEFHRVLGAIPAAAYMCDRDGLITYFNQHAVDLFGREPLLRDARDRFCGSHRLFTADGAPLAHDRCWMARTLQEDRECNSFEVMIERPDGRRVTALAHASPIHDDLGALVGAVNILTDVTDRKRGEEARDDFLASLGHELRNPLVPVTNAVHILRSKPAADAQSKWALDLIERQVEELVGLIDLVSEVSRMAQDDGRRAHVSFDIAALVSAAEESTRALLSRKGQTCALTLPSPGAAAFGDAPRLQRAVESLIQSASRLQRSGETIDVLVAVSTAGWSVVAGPGAALDDVARAEHGAKRVRPNETWAGLIFAERLAELHGGSLVAHVRRDGRLAYELLLPLRPSSAR